MQPGTEAGGSPEPPCLSIPEIRDYQKINTELVALLDAGHQRIRLEGAEGQRLLVSGLSGSWNAVIEIFGRTGPELAANLNALGLVVVARGPTADGAGRGLVAGRLIALGDAGDAAGYAQTGGIVVISGSTGHRAGLRQSGGTLALLGTVGRLAGERQSGGHLCLPDGRYGPHAGHGCSGGRRLEFSEATELDADAGRAWRELAEFALPWLGRTTLFQP